MADPVDVLVSVASTDPQEVSRVADALRAAGMQVESVLGDIGTITGRCAEGSVAGLSRVKGVASVERQRKVGIPPPSSPVQ